jgi:biotin-dependent carboxylase-like uncharacterized protein
MGAAVRGVRIVDAGMLSTVQDLGRPHFGASGVSPSGAADWYCARAANRLAGNDDGAALIEASFGGITIETNAAAAIAVTGAQSRVSFGGRSIKAWQTQFVQAGGVVRVDAAERGARTYIAIDGGLAVPRVLGSAASDVVAGIGGRALRTGDVIAVHEREHTGGWPALAYAANAHADLSSPVVLRACSGPDFEHISAGAMDWLCSTEFRTSSRSNRQAVTFEADASAPAAPANVLTIPVCAGCVQVTGDGMPIVLLADHQATGGYVAAMCVIYADIPRAAQLRPGDRVRFRIVSHAEASAAMAAAKANLSSLRRIDPLAAKDTSLWAGFVEGSP